MISTQLHAATTVVWHPDAIRVPHADCGTFISVPPRVVWHTTEGAALPLYDGSAPHFTLDPATGMLYQHMPIDRAARSLRHPSGTVETNRAHAIQVELVGFAGDTGTWPDAHYAEVARLARWIEAHAGVGRQAAAGFSRHAPRLTASAWLQYSGHCGHQHVPGNDHWDPGDFKIALVLGDTTPGAWPGTYLEEGSSGRAVRRLERRLDALPGSEVTVDGRFDADTDLAVRAFQSANGLDVDGIVGPRTWEALRRSAR